MQKSTQKCRAIFGEAESILKKKPFSGENSDKKGVFSKELCIRFDVSHRCGGPTGGSSKATSWHTKQIRLVLLYPYPDTVHGSPLHKTLSSTLLIGLSHPCDAPGRTCGLAIADCKFRAPLTPHLAQHTHSITKNFFLQAKIGKNDEKNALQKNYPMLK